MNPYILGENKMNLHLRVKIIFLIILGTAFAFSPIISTNLYFITSNSDKHSEYNDDRHLYNDNLKLSKISGKIYINGNSGWSDAKTAGICTGEGIISNPYIIEDLVIDGEGLGSCIWIENSDVFFKIENCTVYNSGSMGQGAGIKLDNTNNSQLIKNNCSSNYNGIRLSYSYNNTISGNIATSSIEDGISLYICENNFIKNNSLYWGRYGIDIFIFHQYHSKLELS